MTSQEVDIVAIITPAAGKEERLINLLKDLAQSVLKDEPGALMYHLHQEAKPDGTQELVMIEKHKDQAAYDHHMTADGFQSLSKIIGEEKLLGGPLVIKKLKPIGGFASRL
ncbi:MAG: hypothetical protein M1827_006100 [Pycnora praestabilis]|nr:MAG: hypothetical protein M1827_006100 [Pycnora praestabilis]